MPFLIYYKIIISCTITQWVLNLWPHPPPIFVGGSAIWTKAHWTFGDTIIPFQNKNLWDHIIVKFFKWIISYPPGHQFHQKLYCNRFRCAPAITLIDITCICSNQPNNGNTNPTMQKRWFLLCLICRRYTKNKGNSALQLASTSKAETPERH